MPASPRLLYLFGGSREDLCLAGSQGSGEVLQTWVGWQSSALLPCQNGLRRDLLLGLGPYGAQVGLLMCIKPRMPRPEDQEVTCLAATWLCGAVVASASTLGVFSDGLAPAVPPRA